MLKSTDILITIAHICQERAMYNTPSITTSAQTCVTMA